jgi:opacity protein-like surface antigen
MSQRNLVLSALTLSLMSAALMPSAARAADLDTPYLGSQQFPEDKVEFGSGWYIRGDLGATRLPSMRVSSPAVPTATDQTIIPTAPTALLGPGSTIGYVASLGGGYQLNRWLRADLVADFHKPVATTSTSGNGNVFCPTAVTYPGKITNSDGSITYGTPDYANGACTGTYQGKLSSYDILVNGYIDLGTWYNVTPYVGAGVGVSFGHYSTSSSYVQANGIGYQVTYTDPKYNTTFYNNFNRTSSGTYYNFAYALMAGVAIDVYDHTKLDIGYRYLNLGKIAGVSNTLYSNEIRAGIRYMIDE